MSGRRRHCERSDLSAEALAKAEAIQNPSADALWIASMLHRRMNVHGC
jgi:hypothetical protein